MKSRKWYLECSLDLRRDDHQLRTRHLSGKEKSGELPRPTVSRREEIFNGPPPVDPLDEDARPDGIGHRLEGGPLLRASHWSLLKINTRFGMFAFDFCGRLILRSSKYPLYIHLLLYVHSSPFPKPPKPMGMRRKVERSFRKHEKRRPYANHHL